MAEIEITLPTVQYGNVKVRATPEEFGFKLDEPSAFGMALAVYQAAFTLGWRDGAQMDVDAPVSASEGEVGRQAQEWLDKGLGGVTELPVGSEAELQEHLGGVTELPVGEDFAKSEGQIRAETGRAPWESKVDAKPKPWENGGEAPASRPVLDEGW